MNFIDKITEIVKENKKTIVLPEADDIKILEAASYILKNDIANIILIGNKDDINNLCSNNNIDIKNAKIYDINNDSNFENYVNELYNLRKEKGMSLEEARDIIKNNPLYYGCMLVRNNIANGMVAGINHTSGETFKSAFHVIGVKDNNKASSFFVMEFQDKNIGDDGILLYADCGLNQNPNSNELANIGILSAKTYKNLFNKEPYVAFLSHSTNASSKHDDVTKVRNAVNIAKENCKDFLFDGEMQFDAAMKKDVAIKKNMSLSVAGHANVLIFPDLDSGNIAYKITEILAGAKAYGPITQGLNKQINDLSRGSSVEDIIGVIIITAYQTIFN